MSNEQNNASPIAYLTEDGERCITAKTYNTARNDGGAIWSTMRPFCVPAYATPPAAAPAPASTQDEPFGYFRVDALGWTDCAATDEGAIALYERPAAPAVPNVLKRGYGRLIQAAADLALQQFMPSDIVDDYPSKTISAAKVAKMMTQPRDRLRLLSIEVSEGAKQMLAATPAAPSQPAVPQGEPVYQLGMQHATKE